MVGDANISEIRDFAKKISFDFLPLLYAVKPVC